MRDEFRVSADQGGAEGDELSWAQLLVPEREVQAQSALHVSTGEVGPLMEQIRRGEREAFEDSTVGALGDDAGLVIGVPRAPHLEVTTFDGEESSAE